MELIRSNVFPFNARQGFFKLQNKIVLVIKKMQAHKFIHIYSHGEYT